MIQKLKDGYSLDFSTIMKQAKAQSGVHLQALNEYYEASVLRFIIKLNLLVGRFGCSVEVLSSGVDEQLLSNSLMSRFALEPYDALHLAFAKKNGINYFVTMDGDFTYVGNVIQIGNKKPIKVLHVS